MSIELFCKNVFKKLISSLKLIYVYLLSKRKPNVVVFEKVLKQIKVFNYELQHLCILFRRFHHYRNIDSYTRHVTWNIFVAVVYARL